MKKLWMLAALLSGVVLPGPAQAGGREASPMPQMATISYWNAADYAKLPSGGVALINPMDGIVSATVAQVSQYVPVVKAAVQRGVKLLAYVPTGYGVRVPGQKNDGGTTGQSLAMIEKEIDTYIAAYGAANLYGIFFDEADEPCAQAVTDYAKLGDYVRSKGLEVAVWNPGWPGDNACFVTAAKRGDIVTTFESDLKAYLHDKEVPVGLAQARQVAKQRGVLTWHLIHTAVGPAALKTALSTLRERQPDFAYVTDLRDWTTGDNTWGKPPSYWAQELKCLTQQQCP